MLQEITSRDVEITFPLSPDVFVSSWSGEIRVDRPEEWFLSFWKKPSETPFLFGFIFQEIMQIERLTSREQAPEFKTETALTEELYKIARQMQCLIKISEMIDKITHEEELFKGIDKHKLLKSISKMLSDISVEWSEIPDKELFERTKRILALEAMSGILKELNPEQIEIFDEAVKRRSLFK